MSELFDVLDTDGDGTLSKAEVVAGAAKLELTEDQAASLFDDMDKDGSGTLTRGEFFARDVAAQFFGSLGGGLGAVGEMGKGSVNALLNPWSIVGVSGGGGGGDEAGGEDSRDVELAGSAV